MTLRRDPFQTAQFAATVEMLSHLSSGMLANLRESQVMGFRALSASEAHFAETEAEDGNEYFEALEGFAVAKAETLLRINSIDLLLKRRAAAAAS